MTIAKGSARLGFVAAVAALLLGSALLSATSANAQNPPATYYGVAVSGDSISAVIGDTTCETVTADAAGEWVIVVAESSCDGNAVAGAVVGFTINGTNAAETETWEAGGAPSDLVNGISLTEGTGSVTPPDTGNAGFAVSGGSAAPWLALSLGLFALAAVAGVRVATTKVR